MDDILLNKAQIIALCLNRIDEEYQSNPDNLLQNQTKQDAIVLNLQRACEAAIDMGTRVIRMKQLGIPQSSRDVFALLEKAGILTNDISLRMQKMVGFRNIAIHDYQALSIEIVQSILDNRLVDFKEFSQSLLTFNA